MVRLVLLASKVSVVPQANPVFPVKPEAQVKLVNPVHKVINDNSKHFSNYTF